MKINRKLLIFITLLMMVFFLSAVTATAGKKSTKGKILDPKNKNSLIYLNTDGTMGGTGDIKKSGLASISIKDGQGWHPAALTESNLPVDRYGLVDWVKLTTGELIDPKWTFEENADPDDEEMLDVDILFEALGDFTDNVIFPHDIHTWWLKCEICHDSVGGPIFEPAAGANRVRMVEMVGGKWCGRCHNRVAFPLTDCKRCHVRPKNAKPDETLVIRDTSDQE